MNDIDRLLADLGIGAAELARRLGVSEAAVSRWRSGRNSPQGLYAARIAELQASVALRRASAEDGPDLAALVAGLLDHAAPPPGPDAAEYERGYRDGYRAAVSIILGSIAGPYATLNHPPLTEHTHERAAHR